ncbi:hypothetical protein [Rhodoblastus sphagnicola]|nr:hypothetical protein [Rhodoblastus sphagnicola]
MSLMTDTVEIGARISVNLPARYVAALDAWRNNQPDAPDRPEALRRLTAMALDALGGSDTIALGELNASNDK